jgi:hypothetical protein
MAAVAKSGTPSIATVVPCSAHRVSGLLAGEALAAGDACRIHTDGKAYKSTGAAANASARVHGYASMAASAGGPVTLYHDVTYHYGSGLTPGTPYYLSGTTAGGLDTAASTGGTAPCAFAVDATRIRLLRFIAS